MRFDIGLLAAFACLGLLLGTAAQQRDSDPCTVIAGQKWVAPKDVRNCYSSIQVDPAIRENIIDVITKSLAFHTSVNYQIKSPEPFTSDVHEDVLADLATYSTKHYSSDYALHVDLSRALKRLNDGHCVWINHCYDSAFINYLPTPLTLLTAPDGSQSVYIAPEAFDVASVEFADQIQFWQDSLPGPLRGQLQTLSGAKVLLINGQPPLDAVNQNAAIAGSFQALGTRQNGFFSSYSLTATGWTYVLGNFAQQALPLSDSVTLTIRRLNQSETDTIILPYRSRIGAINSFTNKSTYLANNCVAVDGTNGIDYYASVASAADSTDSPIIKFQQQPPIPAAVARKHPVNVILDDTPVTDVLLPPTLTPSLPTATGSRAAAQFYLLKDGKTGVLALGSFSDSDYNAFLDSLLAGLVSLKSQGATQLIVDVTNNGGGFICAAHWLHRIIAGPKSTTVPQAGLYTEARAGPLAQLIVGQIVNGNVSDPNVELLYNPLQWTNGSNAPFTATDNWLQPPVKRTVNGHQDAFSPRLGQECQPNGFPEDAPEFALFNSSKVVIVSNGRCASSCSLFSITMAKEEGVRTVVVGGNSGVTQQYCGTVGGQSTDFSTIDSEIKTTHLKNNSLSPPDLLVNGVQGITWRLGFGVNDPSQPEEWQSRPATLNLPVTGNIVNNPVAIWEEVTRRLLA